MYVCLCAFCLVFVVAIFELLSEFEVVAFVRSADFKCNGVRMYMCLCAIYASGDNDFLLLLLSLLSYHLTCADLTV